MSPAHLWERVRDSLWFIPTTMTVAAAGLATGMVWVDNEVLSAREAAELWWLFGGSPEGARGVLVAIASSLITVTGVVFSMTIVALQLASSQFTPRVLQNFTRDRGNQLVLGVFIGTFTYTLLLLRTVRAPIEDGADGFVPAAGVTLAVLLALVSIGFLIFYIHHVARSIEASTIVDRVTHETLGVIRARFPEPEEDGEGAGEGDGEGDGDEDAAPQAPPGAPAEVPSQRSGYVQIVRLQRLVELADEAGLVVRVDAAVGRFVLAGETLASVWPREAAGEKTIEAIRSTFAFGDRRTLPHDVELGLIQLSDIAVKALSPGINDPTTAMMALDRVAELVVALGARPRRESRTGEDGTLRLLVPTLDFARVVEVAFGQARRYGGRDTALLLHLIGVVRQCGRRLGAPERRVLHDALQEIGDQAGIDLEHPADLEAVRRELAAAQRELGARLRTGTRA